MLEVLAGNSAWDREVSGGFSYATKYFFVLWTTIPGISRVFDCPHEYHILHAVVLKRKRYSFSIGFGVPHTPFILENFEKISRTGSVF